MVSYISTHDFHSYYVCSRAMEKYIVYIDDKFILVGGRSMMLKAGQKKVLISMVDWMNSRGGRSGESIMMEVDLFSNGNFQLSFMQKHSVYQWTTRFILLVVWIHDLFCNNLLSSVGYHALFYLERLWYVRLLEISTAFILIFFIRMLQLVLRL